MTFYIKTNAGSGRGRGTRQIRLTAKGYGIGNAVSAAEALAIQRAFIEKLRQAVLTVPWLKSRIAEAEAVLRMIEIKIAEEDYKRTLYKD